MMGRVADGNEIVQHWPFNPKDINANVSSRYSSFSACLPNIFSARLSKARLESYYVLLQTGRQLIIHIFAQNAISLLWRKSTLVAWATLFSWPSAESHHHSDTKYEIRQCFENRYIT